MRKTKKDTVITDITLAMVRQCKNVEAMGDGLVLSHRVLDDFLSKGPCRVNFIIMALCIKGRVQYSINTHEQTVEPGDLLFISERHIVDNHKASPDFECLGIMVSTQFYHGFVQNVKNVSSLLLFSKNYPVVHLTDQEAQTFTNYYQAISEKMGNIRHPYRLELVKSLLLTMFYDMSGVIHRMKQHDQEAPARADLVFTQFIRLLEKNFRTERRVSWYAEQMEITPKYLSELVKQSSKRTPTEWIDSYVLLEIRVQLKNSTKTIKQITDDLHFPNQSFMGKYFKDRVGMSPKEFRKQQS